MWAAIVFLVSLVIGASSDEGPTLMNLLRMSNIEGLLGGALDVMQNDSGLCGSHINFTLQNMRSTWAMKMIDSSTKIPEGVLALQLNHLGNYDECLSVEGVEGPANDTFDAQHCMVTFGFPMDLLGGASGAGVAKTIAHHMDIARGIARELQVPNDVIEVQGHRPQGRGMAAITTGLSMQLSYCLPDTCSPETIRYYFNETVSNISESLLSVTAVSCSQGSKGRSLKAEDWIAIAILIIFGCLCVVSTGYDLLTENKERKEILTAFSWYSNGKKLLATSDSGTDTLHALHGIRFISMCWVVLGHAHTFSVMAPIINMQFALDFLQDFWRLYVTNGTLSVDTFYFLSGLLVCYVFLKQMNKSKKSSFNIPLYYFHRYIRLTPPYAVMIMIHATLIQHMGTGPMWVTYMTALTGPCRTHWWTELLYVNNYVETEKQCLGQGWYLAVDMQLFILSPIVLIPLWKWSRNLSLSFLGILILCGLATAFSVSQIEELPASTLFANQDFQRLLYFPTHTRFTPWLIGVIFGYVIYETKRRKITISRTYALLGWLIGAAALLGSLLGIYPFYKPDTHPTQLENSFYTTFSRPVWALGVGWVAFACVSGVGGPVNTFLSWKVFQPLSRLTYCVYLVHISWQLLKAATVRTSGYLADITMIPTFLSDMMISLLLAVILSLCFESPVIVLEKHLLGLGTKNKNQLPRDPRNLETSPNASGRVNEDISVMDVENNPEDLIVCSSSEQK